MNMPVGSGNDDRYKQALIDADEVLTRLGFKLEPPVPALTGAEVISALRAALMRDRGFGWRFGTFEEQTMPGTGITIYTAARKCPRCGEIEMFVAQVDEFGNFEFAAPAEGE